MSKPSVTPITHLRAECARHPWIIPGIAITASAALGSALPDLIALAHRVLS